MLETLGGHSIFRHIGQLILVPLRNVITKKCIRRLEYKKTDTRTFFESKTGFFFVKFNIMTLVGL